MTRPLPPWFEEDRWVPPPGSVETTNVARLMARHGLDDYRDFLAQSLDPHWFYPAVIDDLGLDWPVPYERLFDTSEGIPWTRWFVGGRTNMTWLAVDRWVERGAGDRLALAFDGEDGTVRRLTFAELSDAVARVAGGLRELGVEAGDGVAVFMPMIPEAAIAILAANRIGAYAAPAFSGFGPDALAERIQIAEAKVLVTADGFLRGGRTVEMKPVADAAADRCPGLEHVVVAERLGLDWPRQDRDVPWRRLAAADPDGPYEWFPPETPCYLGFTSGSTGRPKGAVHGHGRFPYRLPVEMAYCFDVRPGDVVTWTTDMGWVMGPGILTGALVCGAAFVLMEGGIDHPAPDRLWRTVERHGITMLGVAPTVIRMLAAHGPSWVEPFELESLRVIGSTGEPMTAPAWRWMHRHVGRGIRPIVDISGGTEVGCGLLVGSPVVPMRECRFAGHSPGIAATVFDDQGKPVVGELGELVVTAPWPSMTWGFWKEPDRYLQTYWSRWPDVWVHGDRAIIYEDGSAALPGRSDDLIKVAGKRVGPAEYESVAVEVPGVLAAAAVGIPDPVKGETAVVVCLPGTDAPPPEELEAAVAERITAAMGKPMRPSRVLVVDAVPLTRSGKVHRRALRGWLSGTDPGDLSNLDNPQVKETILQRWKEAE